MRTRTWILAGALAASTAALLPQLGLGQPRTGYLPSGMIDITRILPAAPHKGDAQYKADRAIFKATRRWLGTPRGDLATHDVNTDPTSMFADFSCALGVSLTPAAAPATMKLIGTASVDTGGQSGIAKLYFKRLRPSLIDHGPTCQPIEELRGSYDYPSGHATWGWTWATLLAELAPDRATPILTRGRVFGQSRIVCGAHNSSAVDAGLTTASATLAAVSAQPAFQTDLAAARAELDRLRADPTTPRPQNCAAEEALEALPIL